MAVGATILLLLSNTTTENGLQNAFAIAVLITVLISLLVVKEIFLPEESKSESASFFRKWLERKQEKSPTKPANITQREKNDQTKLEESQ